MDKVSQAIGSLQAQMEGHGDTLAIIQNGINDINKTLTLMNGRVGKAHDRIDEITDAIDGDLTIAYMGATDWVETKKKAKWMIFGGSIAGTAGGFSLGKLISGLFS